MRETTITAAGKSWGIYQEALAQTCTYSISPTSQSITSAAATGSVGVTTATGCAWTATSNATWISITSGATGTGNGTVNYSVAANTGTSSRTGTLTIAGQTFTVTQAAAPSGNPNISVSPTSINFGAITNRSSSSKTVTVSNTGAANLAVTSVSLWGSNASHFRYSNGCSSVAPAGSCTITVTFAPFATGSKLAYLNIYSNDPDSSPFTIYLQGTAK